MATKYTAADVAARVEAGDDHSERIYAIRRMYHPRLGRRSRRLPNANRLTLAEARAHCGRADTRKDNEYFDAYEAMGRR